MSGYTSESGYATRRRTTRSLIGNVSVIIMIGLAIGLLIGIGACGADPISGIIVIASTVSAYLWARLTLAAVTLIADIHEMTEARGP